MKLCKRCGNSIPDDAMFCPVCGKVLPEEDDPLESASTAETISPAPTAAIQNPPAVPPSAHPGAPAAAGPRYAPVAPQQPDGGLSTGQYFWTLLLFSIPILGLFFMLFWSFGSTTCEPRRRLARASLLKTGVVSILVAIMLAAGVLAVLSFGSRMLSGFAQDYYGGSDSPDFYSYYDDYGDYYGEYGDYFDDYGDYYGEYGDYFDDYGDYFGEYFDDYGTPSGNYPYHGSHAENAAANRAPITGG